LQLASPVGRGLHAVSAATSEMIIISWSARFSKTLPPTEDEEEM
jgi:hypothetical protein